MYLYCFTTILLSILILGCDSHLDDLQFTCRTHAGCEVFDVCTRNAMSTLQEKLGDIVEEKLKETNQSWVKDIENLKKETKEDNIKGLRQLRQEMDATFKQKLVRITSRMNASFNVMKKSMEETTIKELKDVNNKIDEEVQSTVKEMKVSVRKARREMDEANKKEIESLKLDTNTMVNKKFAEVTKLWNDALTETKNDLSSKIDRAMEKLKQHISVEIENKIKEANDTTKNAVDMAVLKSKRENDEAIELMNTKIQKMDEKLTSMSDRCHLSIEKLGQDIKTRLSNMQTENITLNTVEMMIDAKFKEASKDWIKKGGDSDDDVIYLDEEEYKTHNVSITRRGLCKLFYQGKCYWVIETELAIPYAKGTEECYAQGGEIANVYSSEHLELLKIYLRSLISETRMYIDVWLGMTINIENGEVRYTNGTLATFLEWELGSPSLGESFFSWTGIYVIAKKDPDDKYEGMVNSSPHSIRDGVLCEI
ncbi:uncharacterized protein LOC120335873 [Styela clava]